MNTIVIPLGIIYVAADAKRFEAGEMKDRVNDPWVTPTLASIKAFLTKHTGQKISFDEKDPIPSIVGSQTIKCNICSSKFVFGTVQARFMLVEKRDRSSGSRSGGNSLRRAETGREQCGKKG